MNNKIDKLEILRLYELYGNGGEIAKELQINNYQVYKCLRENGIKPKKVGGKEKHPIQKIISMYENGMSTDKIAKKLCMSSASIWQRLKNHGIKIRTRSEASELRGHTKIKSSDESDVIKRFLDGESAKDIGLSYGTYKGSVYRVLKKNNTNTRSDLKGSNNPAWKGGITSLHTKIRNSKKYNEWRKEIFKERNYTCELSGRCGVELNVHHIKEFSKILQEFLGLHLNDKDDELLELSFLYKPFWDKTNVIVITADIHKKIHKKLARFQRNEKVAIIKRLALDGWSKKQIYTCLHISCHTLQKVLEDFPDINIVSASERQTIGLDREELQKFISLGYSDRKIAKEFGVSHTTIKRYKKKYSLE